MKRGLRLSHLVFPFYVAAALLFTWPLLTRFDSAIPSSGLAFDPCLQAFLIGWDWRSFSGDLLGVFHAPIFHPEPRTLTYMDHMLGETVLAAPAFALVGSIPAAYNFLVILSFAASAWGIYRLVRLLGVPRAGAALSGFLFAFSPYRFANLDLLNQLQTQFLPLGLFFGVRFLQRGRLRDAAGAVGMTVAQVYCGWYYAYFLGIAFALLMIYAMAGGIWPATQGKRTRLAGLVALGLLSVLPVAIPYIEQHFAMPGFRRTLGQAALYSADVLDYVKTQSSSILAGLLSLPTGPQSYWPGIVTIALSVAGVAAVFRGAQRVTLNGYFLLLALASFLLSLGPILHFAGQRIWIPLPYALLYFVAPGFSSMRAPARFAVLALLALCVLAGVGYHMLRRRYFNRSATVWRGIVVALFALAGLSAWNHSPSLLEIPTSTTMPPVYRWLADQPGAGPILEFPVPERDAEESEVGSLRQLYVLYHGKPRLDGNSGFVSPRYREFRITVQNFPDDRSLADAADLGARWIVVHYADYAAAEGDSLRVRIAGEARLPPRANFDGDVVYELMPVSPPTVEVANPLNLWNLRRRAGIRREIWILPACSGRILMLRPRVRPRRTHPSN